MLKQHAGLTDRIRHMLDCLVKSNALAYNCFIQALCLTDNKQLAEVIDAEYTHGLHCRTAVEYEQNRMGNLKSRHVPSTFSTELSQSQAVQQPQSRPLSQVLSEEHLKQMQELIFKHMVSPRNSIMAVLEEQNIKTPITCTQENSIQVQTNSNVFNIIGNAEQPLFTLSSETIESKFKRNESTSRASQTNQRLLVGTKNHPVMGIASSRVRSRSTTPMVLQATSSNTNKFVNSSSTNRLTSFVKRKSGGTGVSSLATQCMTPSSSNHCLYSAEPSTPVSVSDDRDSLNDISSPSTFYASTGNPLPPSTYDDISWDDVNELDSNFVVYKSLPIQWNEVKPNEVRYLSFCKVTIKHVFGYLFFFFKSKVLSNGATTSWSVFDHQQ
jgi:hypothetical protein